MDNYNISDYSIFQNAATTNNTMTSNVEKHGDEMQNMDALYDANIFDGPIASVCQEEVAKISQSLFAMRDYFKPISSTLETFSQNYQQADQEAGNVISSVE